jgi:hypothetical protein
MKVTKWGSLIGKPKFGNILTQRNAVPYLMQLVSRYRLTAEAWVHLQVTLS